MPTTVCFGEIMARFSPPGHLRIGQAMPGLLETTFAGAEVNSAVAIARLGGDAEFVSALPANPIGDAALAVVRAAGVGVRHVMRREEGRCGLYFVETGAGQRGGLVHYDREGSTFAVTGATAYAWPAILRGASWFHTSGISAGVSRLAAAVTHAAVQAAEKAGLTVSCDLNFRRKLWRWEPGAAPEQLARRTLETILPHVHVMIGNPHDVAGVLGETLPEYDGTDLEVQVALAGRVAARFPNLQWIAMTLRENDSASDNTWGGLLYRTGDRAVYTAPLAGGRYQPYEIRGIVDRVGTGDVFAGALILALQGAEAAEPGRALAFAVAASCLAHSMVGDFFQGTRAEAEALMRGEGNGYLSR